MLFTLLMTFILVLLYLYKTGRATFVLSKKRNTLFVLTLSSRKDPPKNESVVLQALAVITTSN